MKQQTMIMQGSHLALQQAGAAEQELVKSKDEQRTQASKTTPKN